MANPTWTRNADGTVTLTIPSDPPAALILKPQDVLEIIKVLGNLRPSLNPPIPRDWPMGQKVEAVPDPRWVVEPELMQGHSVLHILDPRFGWLHYLFPRHEAKNLGEFLIRQAETPQPGSGKAN
jgi:hypothetical protein